MYHILLKGDDKMKTNAELKMEAKQMLQGRWKESVLMCVIPTLIAISSVIVSLS